MANKVDPIVIKNPDTGEQYTLEFNRESVSYAEKNGFNIDSIADGKYLTGMGDLFFYAFRMHHRYIKRADTDRILFEELGGLPDGVAERLGELFAAPYKALTQDEESAKNSKWTVEL